MLNDYEITRVENEKVNYILSVLKLVAGAVAILCSIILLPNLIDEVYETRNSTIDNSLKIRVVANSNTTADQQLKNEVVDSLQPIFTEIQKNELNGVDNDESYAQLATFVEKHYPQENIQINIGDHLIPPKLDANTFYPQHVYNSLVLTIGNGRGDNWWCSIFGNVCESAQEKEDVKETEKEEPEVKFFIWEWIKKLFS
ncbi:stage II sporulation protein R [Ureibacillus xyleni]|uniref:Stage II sporulation protein R n=1 Tax=Ureibacillus xyleni TaxID=614648 RepID=A0A285R7B4_9BACL|nr:stage II sporulation protein R [Ureibacillus xyleni]SOB89995.1 stage II sporulation protein R [Ureibacillus xyleni]